MMADRYKTIFFAIISLTIVWFIIVLLCLPQQNDDNLLLDQQQHQLSAAIANPTISLGLITKSAHQQPSSVGQSTINTSSQRHEHYNDYAPRIPQYMRYFQSKKTKKKKRHLSKLDIIFYQLNTGLRKGTVISNDSDSTTTKDQHLKETLELKAINNPTDRYVKSEGDRLFAFNLLVSNRIGFFRPLPDTRHAKCSNQLQSSSSLDTNAKLAPAKLASIIICYYNEAPSALLRTIYSILERTGRDYMQEIIVVDDSSEPEYDITKIKPFISDHPMVVLTRTKKREGLIRARLFGSDMARGDILLFLDSHVEPNINWIDPLIGLVRENKSTIACPIIDLINAETLIYSSSPLVKGGMNWALNFKWDSVPSDKLQSYDDFVKPIESPTMAGGLFAIDKEFFYTLGSYDRGMELWGGENIELSLRTWMCGGKIVILPCSRVGHIFRKRRPYGPEPDQPDSLLLNSHRVARVWLDSYIDKFYEANPDAKYLISGDVSKRLDLRHKLGCKNFTWFLENVYPNLLGGADKSKLGQSTSSNNNLQAQRNRRAQRQVAVTSMRQFQLASGRKNNLINEPSAIMSFDSENDRLTGGHRLASVLPKMVIQFQIQSKNSDLCIESKRIHTGNGFTRLVLSRCAKIERNNEGEISLISNSTILDQIWTETELHDLRLGPNRCLDVFKNLPLLRKCHNIRGSFQDWSYNAPPNQTTTITSDTNIFNTRAGLCLGVERVQIEEPIIVTICDKGTYKRHNYTAAKSHYQSWRWRQTQLGLSARSGVIAAESMTMKQRQTSSEYHLNHTRPSQSWNLLLVNNSVSKIHTGAS